jgi:hypothetical protein
LEPGKPDNIEIIKYGKVWKDVRQLPATQNIPNQPATPCPWIHRTDPSWEGRSLLGSAGAILATKATAFNRFGD